MVSPSASDFVVVMVSTPLLVIKMENNRDNMQRGCFGDGRREASLLSIDTTSDMVGLSAALSCPKPPSPSLFTSEKFSVAADTLEKLNHGKSTSFFLLFGLLLALVSVLFPAPMPVPRSNDNKSFPAALSVYGFGSLMHNKQRDSNIYNNRFAKGNLSSRLIQHTCYTSPNSESYNKQVNLHTTKHQLYSCKMYFAELQDWNSVSIPFFCNFLLKIQ
ncbi:hypothetical protein RHMOL_Rhmol04G0030600 [Rhododendron molle]|uniref:Uncharacterized protein n=1 Tax=Rhododendron molle TaxID=49168 RepID=A0ACC0NXU5_RHOML|nr:hypothetical protein RHMOL_Rhmol04G0030600 [Rhododendron molle]